MGVIHLVLGVTIVLARMVGALIHQEYQEENANSKSSDCNRAHCLTKRFKTQLHLPYRCDHVVE